MSTRKGIPAPLTPYLKLPPELSLILLTGTLGCSTTWLTSRFVGAALVASREDGMDGEGQAVIFVSWLRDEAFWRGEIRRATGVDISKRSSSGEFAFVDGLSALATTAKPDAALASIERTITTAMQNLPGKRILLILDAPDALLATAATSTHALNHFILALRSKVHSTIITLFADLPLVSASTPSLAATTATGTSQPTPLETENAAFLVQQAHAVRLVMGVRELDTGAAKDVSGVLRVTRGGDGDDGFAEREGGDEGVREMEALYFVGRDGGAKVFERASAQ